MTLSVTSMNFYGIYRGFYDIETGFYDIEVGVYEIDRQVYEIDGWFDAMRHWRIRCSCRAIVDWRPMRNRCEVVCYGVSLREAWLGTRGSAVGCVTSLFRRAESFMLLSWGLSREPMMLRPQPTMVGWGLNVLNLVWGGGWQCLRDVAWFAVRSREATSVDHHYRVTAYKG